mgnify:CR=1 FL=1
MAFFSKSLHGSQWAYPAAEKEALAIAESVKHWSHFLGRKKFRPITDQRAVVQFSAQSSGQKLSQPK